MLHLPYKVNGFTLIEIMVVIIIIGVILTFTTLSIGDGGMTQKLKQEAQRLASLLTLASEEAIMQSKEMGVSFEPGSYNFYVLQEQQWQLIQNDIFRPRKIPSQIQSILYLENEPIVLNDSPQNTPQLLILSNGEWTPFKIVFIDESDETQYYQLTGTLTGKISIQTDNEINE